MNQSTTPNSSGQLAATARFHGRNTAPKTAMNVEETRTVGRLTSVDVEPKSRRTASRKTRSVHKPRAQTR